MMYNPKTLNNKQTYSLSKDKLRNESRLLITTYSNYYYLSNN